MTRLINKRRGTLAALPVVLALAACGSTQPRGTTQGLSGSNGTATASLPPGAAAAGDVATPPSRGSTDAAGIGHSRTAFGVDTVSSSSSGSRHAGPVANTARSNVITVGVLLTDPGQNDYSGISAGNTVTEQQMDDALFRALNNSGGIVGKKVVPVYAATHTSATNWSTDFAAACQTFTQDHHVDVVLGYLFTYDRNFETCLSNHNVPHLMTGFNVPDATELAKHPLHRALAVPTIDVRSLAKLRGALDEGILTPKNKLAIALDSCPGTLESWARTAKPLLDSHHIPYIVEKGDCSTGNNSGTSDGVAGVPNTLLKLRQEHVDTLTFLTTSEGPLFLVVAAAAEAQHWTPNYIVSSLANLATLQQQGAVPTDQLEHTYSYGWMPSQDVGPAQQPAPVAGQRKCLAMLRSEHVVPTQFGDYANAYRICDPVFAFQLAAQRTAGNLAGQAVVAALDSLGSSFSNPDVLDGAAVFGPRYLNNAPARVRDDRWNTSCSCFQYTGPARPMPTS